jgi:hypothetical protein
MGDAYLGTNSTAICVEYDAENTVNRFTAFLTSFDSVPGIPGS